MRVLAAMSGGVDSAVAAARLVDAGHDRRTAMYALCLDYKDDQVHAPFIMRRRAGTP